MRFGMNVSCCDCGKSVTVETKQASIPDVDAYAASVDATAFTYCGNEICECGRLVMTTVSVTFMPRGDGNDD